MIDIKSNINETGIVETLCVLHNHASDPEIMIDASFHLPVPKDDIHNKLNSIVESLAGLKKKKLLFLTPEIAVIERLDTIECIEEVIICLPSDYEEDTYERIFNNKPIVFDGKPVDIKITFIKENEVPLDFTGNNAAIVVFGFCDDERALILNYNYRMMERYKAFYGYKILVSCGNHMSSARPVNWTPINTHEFFNSII